MLTTYWHWLALLSVLFALAERLYPRDREQPMMRRGFATDLFYLVFNGHALGWGLALASEAPAQVARDWLLSAGLIRNGVGVAAGLHLAIQIPLAFVLMDFMQWCIHNALHRMPVLWRFHRVHHSIEAMDFAGSFRFHFVEAIVYRVLQYVPLAMLGFSGPALFVVAVVGTFIGHLNHANLRLKMGPLVYILNGPEMHVWHHVHPEVARATSPALPATGVNFAINLAVWDWLFGTAYLPMDRQAPERLGLDEREQLPSDPLRQTWMAFWGLSARSAPGPTKVALGSRKGDA